MYQRKQVQRSDVVTVREFVGVEYWHLLQSAGGQEFKARDLLSMMGLRTYVPLQVKLKRIAKSRIRARHQPVSWPAFKGYLFVGFARGGADWQALFDTGYIRGVIGVNGAPRRITNAEVATIATRQRQGDFDKTKIARSKPNLPDVKPGEVWRIDHSGFEGLDLRVESVDEQSAKVIVDMLGQENIVQISLDAFKRRVVEAIPMGGCVNTLGRRT